MVERVIEEQAKGAPEKAEAIRASVATQLGGDLRKLKPGSPQALELKKTLIAAGAWSQYLEVGIGPDPEVFTKAPVLASVGFGACPLDSGVLRIVVQFMPVLAFGSSASVNAIVKEKPSYRQAWAPLLKSSRRG